MGALLGHLLEGSKDRASLGNVKSAVCNGYWPHRLLRLMSACSRVPRLEGAVLEAF